MSTYNYILDNFYIVLRYQGSPYIVNSNIPITPTLSDGSLILKITNGTVRWAISVPTYTPPYNIFLDNSTGNLYYSDYTSDSQYYINGVLMYQSNIFDPIHDKTHLIDTDGKIISYGVNKPNVATNDLINITKPAYVKPLYDASIFKNSVQIIPSSKVYSEFSTFLKLDDYTWNPVTTETIPRNAVTVNPTTGRFVTVSADGSAAYSDNGEDWNLMYIPVNGKSSITVNPTTGRFVALSNFFEIIDDVVSVNAAYSEIGNLNHLPLMNLLRKKTYAFHINEMFKICLKTARFYLLPKILKECLKYRVVPKG
jgi:hypothetical protein